MRSDDGKYCKLEIKCARSHHTIPYRFNHKKWFYAIELSGWVECEGARTFEERVIPLLHHLLLVVSATHDRWVCTGWVDVGDGGSSHWTIQSGPNFRSAWINDGRVGSRWWFGDGTAGRKRLWLQRCGVRVRYWGWREVTGSWEVEPIDVDGLAGGLDGFDWDK